MKTAQFTKGLTIALQPEIFEKIKKITDEEKTSIAEWTRAAIDTALKTNQQKGDLCNEQ